MTHRGPFQPLPFCDSVIRDFCALCLKSMNKLYLFTEAMFPVPKNAVTMKKTSTYLRKIHHKNSCSKTNPAFSPFNPFYFQNPISKLQEAGPLPQLYTALRNPKHCLALAKISQMTTSILKDRDCLGKILQPVLRPLPASCHLFFPGPYLASQGHPRTTVPAVGSHTHASAARNDTRTGAARQKPRLY